MSLLFLLYSIEYRFKLWSISWYGLSLNSRITLVALCYTPFFISAILLRMPNSITMVQYSRAKVYMVFTLCIFITYVCVHVAWTPLWFHLYRSSHTNMSLLHRVCYDIIYWLYCMCVCIFYLQKCKHFE